MKHGYAKKIHRGRHLSHLHSISLTHLFNPYLTTISPPLAIKKHTKVQHICFIFFHSYPIKTSRQAKLASQSFSAFSFSFPLSFPLPILFDFHSPVETVPWYPTPQHISIRRRRSMHMLTRQIQGTPSPSPSCLEEEDLIEIEIEIRYI
jgi:hypothetical protein